MSHAPRASVILLAAVLAGAAAHAQSYGGPTKVGYAGCATDASGAPYSGPQGVTLRLFDAASGGAPLKSYDYSSASALGTLQFSNGCFSVELDLASSPALSLDALDKPLFLEITIAGNVTYSRIPFDLVPYSAWAGAVHWADVRDRPSLVQSLSAGQGLVVTSADAGAGTAAYTVGVDYAQVQRRLSDAGCPGGQYLSGIDPSTGALSCGSPGAASFSVGPGLLVGSSSSNAGSSTVSTSTPYLGVNFSSGGGLTTVASYSAGQPMGGYDAGTLATANGTSPLVARADHLHPERVVIPTSVLGVADYSSGSPFDQNAMHETTFVTTPLPAAGYGQAKLDDVLLGYYDRASFVVPMPLYPVRKVTLRVQYTVTGTNLGYLQANYGTTRTLPPTLSGTGNTTAPLRLGQLYGDPAIAELTPKVYGSGAAPSPGDYLYVEFSFPSESTFNQPNISARIYAVELYFSP